MDKHRVHIAVLDTDVPCHRVYLKRGLYSSQFRRLLEGAAERLNNNLHYARERPLDVRVTAFDVVGGSLPPLECLRTKPECPTESYPTGHPGPIDAILVTGAAAAAYDDLFWIPGLESYIQTVHTTFPLVKIFGSCFGHQLIGQALLTHGQESASRDSPVKVCVEASQDGHEIGVRPIALNPTFKSRFPPLAGFSQENPFRLQLIHGDAVVTYSQLSTGTRDKDAPLPKPWINIGSTDKCTIQGLYYPGRVLTLQGHFEFDAFATAELCYQFSRTYNWAPPLLETHLKNIWASSRPGLDDDDNSAAAAEAVLLFFAGEDRVSDSDTDTAFVNGEMRRHSMAAL